MTFGSSPVAHGVQALRAAGLRVGGKYGVYDHLVIDWACKLQCPGFFFEGRSKKWFEYSCRVESFPASSVAAQEVERRSPP